MTNSKCQICGAEIDTTNLEGVSRYQDLHGRTIAYDCRDCSEKRFNRRYKLDQRKGAKE